MDEWRPSQIVHLERMSNEATCDGRLFDAWGSGPISLTSHSADSNGKGSLSVAFLRRLFEYYERRRHAIAAKL